MSKQNQNQNRPNQNQNQTPRPAANTTAEQVNNTEETISGFIRDCRRNIKDALKGQKAIEVLPATTPELKAGKEQMLNALKGQKELIAKQGAQKVFEYLMKTEA